MHRFRIDTIADGDMILLSDAGRVHHLRDVLRLAVGDEITMFDDGGHECLCVIVRFSEKGVTLSVRARQPGELRKAKLTVACALPKKGMDEVVDKLTQLGVDTIIPMRTARVVVRLSEAVAAGRRERWKRLAQAAAEQSQRSSVPEIGPVTDLGRVILQAGGFDLKLMPTLSGDRKALGEVLGDTRPGRVLVLIGPEGDFTDEEVGGAREAGFLPVSLGPQVLRVDTAAIAVAAYLRLFGVI